MRAGGVGMTTSESDNQAQPITDDADELASGARLLQLHGSPRNSITFPSDRHG